MPESGRTDAVERNSQQAKACRRAIRGVRAAAVVAGLALIGAGTVISPAASATADPAHGRAAREAAISVAVQSLINLERGVHGLAPLQMRFRLRKAARAHNQAMAAADELSHQLPGEPDLGDRLHAVHYAWSFAGENVAWNSATSRAGVLQLERLMYREKPPENGHRLNILSPNYQDVGVDVYFDPAHHKVWLTTDFGRLLPRPAHAR